MKGITMMGCSRSASSAILLALLLVAFFGVEVTAKRGCSAFGHSCYGGHGKRSYPDKTDIDLARDKEEVQQQVDYDLARSNGENIALASPQGYDQHEQRALNSILDRPSSNSWSLFIRKLLVPFRRPYMAYSETQK